MTYKTPIDLFLYRTIGKELFGTKNPKDSKQNYISMIHN